ncbi:MAG: response regulator [Planctomycetales bacterium]|nr:response regulator [Planctomycetales bacterium]
MTISPAQSDSNTLGSLPIVNGSPKPAAGGAPTGESSRISSLREKLKELPTAKVASRQPSSPSQQTEGRDSEPQEEPQPAAPSAKVATQASGSAQILGDDASRLHDRRIMIVDDEETNILTVQAYLEQNGYRQFLSTVDAREALPLIKRNKPDVLLLDINMPHVSGLEILRCLAADNSAGFLPVLVLTAATDPSVKQQALELGVSDFLTKPVDPHDLIPRVRNALLIKSHMDHIAGENVKLDALVRRRTADLSRSRQQLILSLAKAAEHRDDDTGNHVLRVGRYAGIIARQLGWPEARVQMIELAAQLHDVGKIGISDLILLKPGRLTREEFSLMKKHCEFGRDILQPRCWLTGFKTPISSPIMEMAARIAMSHHEWWNGAGYPLGLSGEEIPIEGRITAVADVFDALSSQRPYKAAYPLEKCFKIMEQNRGTQFDPRVFDSFMNLRDWIEEIHAAYPDPTSSSDQLVAEPTW